MLKIFDKILKKKKEPSNQPQTNNTNTESSIEQVRNQIIVLWWVSTKKKYTKETGKLPKKYMDKYNFDYDIVFLSLLNDSYIQEQSNLFAITEKGYKFLATYNCFIIMFKHPEYQLSYADFCSNKMWHTIQDNDIVWAIFNNRQLQFTKTSAWDDLYRNYINMSNFLYEERRLKEALYMVYPAVFISCSGMHNNNILTEYNTQKGYFDVLYLEIAYYDCGKLLKNIMEELSLSVDDIIMQYKKSEQVIGLSTLLPFTYLNIEQSSILFQYALNNIQEKGIYTLTDLYKAGVNLKFNKPNENSTKYFYNSFKNRLNRDKK